VKRVLLLSDTHGHWDELLLQRAAEHDEVWHAGDWGGTELYDLLSEKTPVRGVYGNIDDQEVRMVCPEEQVFTFEGLKVYMTHICGYPGRYKTRAYDRIRAERPGLVVAGHSHILKVQYDPKLMHLHLNPGAMGLVGFHKLRTMLSFGVLDGEVKELKVLEYPK
jgi:putative phosphoesterase